MQARWPFEQINPPTKFSSKYWRDRASATIKLTVIGLMKSKNSGCFESPENTINWLMLRHFERPR